MSHLVQKSSSWPTPFPRQRSLRPSAVRSPKALSGARFAQRVARNLARADLKLTITEYLLIKAFTVVLGWLVGQFIGRGAGPLQLLLGLIFAVLGWFAPDWYVRVLQGRRIRSIPHAAASSSNAPASA